ncbi:hypothetical protein [Micromonospora sp. RTP1Z1]|uniref:hypothetical protein n=1 Tax=Micromonospora sp. RTP1Z1 TaxID=2994043 RepID=UPI0029C7F531|nr:hypothetical protein [Micromonospora sp. RTP1Z1]
MPGDLMKAVEGGEPAPAGLSADEKRAFEALSGFFLKNAAYGLMMQTRSTCWPSCRGVAPVLPR